MSETPAFPLLRPGLDKITSGKVYIPPSLMMFHLLYDVLICTRCYDVLTIIMLLLTVCSAFEHKMILKIMILFK